MSDEPLGDDTKPRSFDVTFSTLYDFNDDYTLRYDNLFFNEEFEDISSLDPPELTPLIDKPTLLVTLPLSCTDVLGNAIVDIALPLGEHLDTLSMRDREIDFNPSNSDLMSRSSVTSDLFEELIAEFGLDDLIPSKIDDRYHDSEGGKTRVLETHSFGFHHMPSPRPAAYSPKEVMYRYYHPHLTLGDGFDDGPKMK
ncbi:hypothetical protein Tco_0139885 [Tanacetum coccineum]